jgi:hypothetical protein
VKPSDRLEIEVGSPRLPPGSLDRAAKARLRDINFFVFITESEIERPRSVEGWWHYLGTTNIESSQRIKRRTYEGFKEAAARQFVAFGVAFGTLTPSRIRTEVSTVPLL